MRLNFRVLGISCAAVIALSSALAFAAESKDNKIVKDGSVVTLQYTLSGDDGKTHRVEQGQRSAEIHTRQSSDYSRPGEEPRGR